MRVDQPVGPKTETIALSLEELIGRVLTGKVRVPPFQRPIRWEAGDVARLFDSMYRAFPIGTLLFWERPAPAGPVVVGPIKTDGLQETSAWFVVDGQQRVSAIAGALSDRADSNDARFRVAFDLADERFVDRWSDEAGDRYLPVRRANDLAHVLAWTRAREPVRPRPNSAPTLVLARGLARAFGTSRQHRYLAGRLQRGVARQHCERSDPKDARHLSAQFLRRDWARER